MLHTLILTAQDSTTACKVRTLTINASYTGECKHGLANGQGKAFGKHRYKGSFKFGKPNGSGIYYYNDSTYHAGLFQDGQKEGKGETYYQRKGLADSIVKGY